MTCKHLQKHTEFKSGSYAISHGYSRPNGSYSTYTTPPKPSLITTICADCGEVLRTITVKDKFKELCKTYKNS
jgi:hypothetical protein